MCTSSRIEHSLRVQESETAIIPQKPIEAVLLHADNIPYRVGVYVPIDLSRVQNQPSELSLARLGWTHEDADHHILLGSYS